MEQKQYMIDGYSEVYNSVTEAIIDYIEDYLFESEQEEEFIVKEDDGDYIYQQVLEVKEAEDEIDAEHIVEMMSNIAYDEYDDAENYCMDLESADRTWLNEQINKVWKEWKKRENISFPFLETVCFKEYKVKVEDKKVISFEEVEWSGN